jgi:membrane-bound serine protease (ClpP class)
MEPGVGLAIGLFVAGLLAIVAEIFIPGGVVGTMGGLAIVAAVILGFREGSALGTVLLVAGVILVPACLVGAMQLAPKLPFSKKLFLQESLDADKGYVAQKEGLGELVGREGVATTDLRPSGMAEIDGSRTDVVTGGEMIEKGTQIKVVHVEGNRVVVEAKSV